jgi:eukaryotic-like serine/threonine-protein kinase
MADHASLGYTLSLSAERRHDELCNAFEDDWRAGRSPRIEDVLPRVPEPERPALFDKLLQVELAYRSGAGPDEYRARFPDYAALVDSIFRNAAGDVPPSRPPPIPGYEIDDPRPIGTGGMGVVYKARHTELGRPAAVKLVKAGAWGPMAGVHRFQLEARAVAALNHANVVQIYDFGQTAGVPYYVMEFVEGGSLAGRLTGSPADPSWSAELVETVARAMQFVHENKIVHRDLKPANILLTADGTPKVSDFGLAKRLAGDDPQLTATWAVLGTACYMAPEQAKGETKFVGPAADVWALGAILYECLTGRPPFRAATFEHTIVQVLNEDPVPPADLVAGLAADLQAVCLKCLEKDPARRYPSAQDLADDLRRFRAGDPVQARPLNARDQAAKWADRVGYDVGELVGRSPWADTYTARHRPINRTVLLKLSTGLVGSPQHATLRREAEALAGLEIPFVIRLHDYGERHGRAYLVLEWVEGGVSLARRLRHAEGATGDSDIDPVPAGSSAPLSSREAARVALMVALGLKAVHDHGFLHCGLNPRDIVLTQDGEPKLTNFAAARRPGEGSGPDVPFPDWVPPNYLAPELLARDWARLGPATDVYALGAVLHETLTGIPPRVRSRELAPPEPTSAILDSEPSLATICRRCLEMDPSRRYAGAGAVGLALQRFLIPPSKPEDRSSTVYDDGAAVATHHSGPATPFRLRVLSGGEMVGATLPLPAGPVTVGRGEKSDLRLEWDVISQKHCGIHWNDETRRHEVVDLGSKNGTMLNDRRVRGSRALVPGDRISLPGPVVLVYEMDDSVGADSASRQAP